MDEKIVELLNQIRQAINNLQNLNEDLPAEFIRIFERIEGRLPNPGQKLKLSSEINHSELNYDGMRENWDGPLIAKFLPEGRKFADWHGRTNYRYLRKKSLELSVQIDRTFRRPPESSEADDR
ncbi:hypothetical protein ACVDG9_18330 [Roseibium sp. RP-7]